jgi:hypothetical protein
MTYPLPAWLSYSQASSYLRCGEAYRLERLVGAPSRPGWALPGGSAVHEATEEYDRALHAGTPLSDDWDTLFNEHFNGCIADQEKRSGMSKSEFRASGRASKQYPNKEDEAWWRENGPVMVARWASWRANTPWNLYVFDDDTPAIEVMFEIVVGGTPLRGAIDRVFITPENEIVLLDLKSGREPDSDLQLGTYAKAMRDQYTVPATWGTYWMARTGSNTPCHPLDLYSDAYLDHHYGEARRGMEAGLFPAKVSNMCGSCGVRDACWAVGGKDAAKFSPLPVDKIVE